MTIGDAILAVSLFLVVIIGVCTVQDYHCHAMWEGSGMPAQWGPLKGCRVKHDGRWIPAENYREMP